MTGAEFVHAPRCQRTRPPILRLSWQAHPEAWCPECGRTAPADDTRPLEYFAADLLHAAPDDPGALSWGAS